MESQIYYHDTDAGGVVYYGRYLQFLEEARTEFLSQKGLSVPNMHKKGILYAVRECNVKYKKPARYGDTIICDAKVTKITATQIVFEQNIYKKSPDELLVTAEVTLVSLTSDFKPTPIPEDVKSALTA